METIREYEKIDTIYERDFTTKKLIDGQFRDKTVEFLKDIEWDFTEKIDGTNIRVYWDGHTVSFYGRTEKAQIPSMLLNKLTSLFCGNENEEIFEQLFGETPVMLIGEGYGAKIQKAGGDYLSDDNDFILFDVFIAGNYQSRETVEEIATKLNLKTVPIIFSGKLEEGVDYVKSNPMSTIGKAKMEGLVARPKYELRDRCGHRIIVKIKCVDFKGDK